MSCVAALAAAEIFGSVVALNEGQQQQAAAIEK
jgi:hypothetical protein